MGVDFSNEIQQFVGIEEKKQEETDDQQDRQKHLMKIVKEGEVSTAKLHEDLLSKQQQIWQLKDDVSQLKKENQKYKGQLEELDAFLEQSKSKRESLLEQQQKSYEEKIRQLEKAVEDTLEERNKLREASKSLQMKNEGLEIKVENNDKMSLKREEQLRQALKELEDARDELGRKEKLTVQQAMEIDQYEGAVQNLRQSVANEQQKVSSTQIESMKIQQENAKLTEERTEIIQRAEEKVRQNEILVNQVRNLEKKAAAEETQLKQLDEQLSKEFSRSEKLNEQLMVEQKLNDRYKKKTGEVLEAKADLELQLKIKDERLRENEKQLESKENEVKAYQKIAKLNQEFHKTEKNGAERKKVEESGGIEKRQSQTTKHVGDTNENIQDIKKLETKVDCLLRLCIQSKQQSDLIRDEVTRALEKKNAKENADVDNSGGTQRRTQGDKEDTSKPEQGYRANNRISGEQLCMMQRQIETCQKVHEMDAKQTQRAWDYLRLNLQKLNEAHMVLSGRINCLQWDVAEIKHQVG